MKMISRRDFLKASAVVGATAAMTACGGFSSTSTAASSVASSTAASAAATNGSANIGVCIYQFADNFMTLYRTDLEEIPEGHGLRRHHRGRQERPEHPDRADQHLLQQGVDVLVINPVQTTSAQTIVDTISPSAPPSSSSTVSPTRLFWIPTLASAATSVQTLASPVLTRAS